VGTINNTLHESGVAAMSMEDELVEAVLESQLLHVDETSWLESGTLLWLWVFSADTVTAYWIAYRSSELIDNILGQAYGGWLMSVGNCSCITLPPASMQVDGYQAYRKYPHRLRCWAHLLRKAKGLEESFNQEAQAFGKKTQDFLGTLMAAIGDARHSPPGTPLTETHQAQLAAYRRLCEHMKTAPHDKAKALATEMLNDWDAIFRVLHHPHLPLTNNEAERALRHWVILRRISHGTRTEEGSRSFAILISIIETCRKRQQSPWIYLAAVIYNHRTGLAVPKLPIAKGSE
jgi:hypothetical protein